jgi:NAD(P)-dependent dehydrogenase (short-subunit alcohol dehydrogenase family)
MDIAGKVAIVTGAASGVGLGIATALAEAGAKVALADIQKAAVEQAAHGLAAAGKSVVPVVIDVSDDESVAAAAREVERAFGKLHIACNNAGVPLHGTKLVDVRLDEWDWLIGVNIYGVIHGIRHFVPAILKHGEGGHVVNTSSGSGLHVRRGTNQGAYAMSKYAVLALSEALEIELEGTNVGVTVLCPGAVDTNISEGAKNRPERMGGAFHREQDAFLRERLAREGMAPVEVGRKVVGAIRDGQFFLFVSNLPHEVIEARQQRISAAIAQFLAGR